MDARVQQLTTQADTLTLQHVLPQKPKEGWKELCPSSTAEAPAQASIPCVENFE